MLKDAYHNSQTSVLHFMFLPMLMIKVFKPGINDEFSVNYGCCNTKKMKLLINQLDMSCLCLKPIAYQ